MASLTFDVAGGIIAEVPGSYSASVQNPWVIYFHGYNETDASILTGNYSGAEQALLSAGYVVIAMNNTVQNCYGNAQCVQDVKALIEAAKEALSLTDRPFVMADSMGGFTMLNAIARGAVSPIAAVGWCINTNLGWDYTSGGARVPITADYDISEATPYAEATQGADPMLGGGAIFAQVPLALWSSYADTVVLREQNTDPFASMVRAAGGSVVVHTSQGNHMDPSNFDPAAIIAFFQQHSDRPTFAYRGGRNKRRCTKNAPRGALFVCTDCETTVPCLRHYDED